MKAYVVMLAGLCAVVSGSSGCLVHTVDKEPKPPIELPDHIQLSEDPHKAGADDQPDPGRWWRAFSDDDLNRLVDAALADNLELKQYWARLEQAEALNAMASAGLWPQLNANLSANRSHSAPREMNFGGQTTTIDGVTSDTYNAGLGVSYELDLWGRVRSALFAAEQDAKAVRADVETAATTVAANVAERWFDIIEKHALRHLLNQQQRTNQIFLELVMLRFGQGDAALSEIYQQRQQVQATSAQLALVAGQEKVAAQQLAVLIGKPPNELVTVKRTTLPEIPPLPATGVPSHIIYRRPDLRSARRRVIAADYRVGEAIAKRLPSFTLNGNLGFQSPDISSFFESFVWSITGSIAASIWDGGARAAEEERTRAVVKERLHAYGQALLTALLEIESGLVSERQQRRNIAVQVEQVKTARLTLEAARRRYRAGLGNFIPVLTALRSQHASEQSLLSARRQLLSQRIRLYRAIGSHWTKDLKPPKEPDEESGEGEGKEAEQDQED